MPTFDEWFEERDKHNHYPHMLAQEAWEAGAKAEREACAALCRQGTDMTDKNECGAKVALNDLLGVRPVAWMKKDKLIAPKMRLLSELPFAGIWDVPLYAIPAGWKLVPVEPTDEIERLRAALFGCVELAEFWIGQGREPNMSKERYEVWLALGHRSQQMQAAKAAVSPMTPNTGVKRPAGREDT